MGCNYLAPWKEATLWLTFRARLGRLAVFSPCLLLVAGALQFQDLVVDLIGLRGRDVAEQPGCRIAGTERIVETERLLMRPAVTNIAQFADVASLRMA